MNCRLPLRFRILHWLTTRDAATPAEIVVALRDEYGSDGQLDIKRVGAHLASMQAAGLVKDQHLELDAAGKLLVHFAATPFGASRLRYLPKGWQAPA